MVASSTSLDRSCLRTWSGTYPPKGGAEAVASVTERDGGFDVAVTTVGWALDRHGVPSRQCREETLEAARARADALAADLLGREVFARWREAAAEDP
jgi:hypothetical protein